MLTGGHWTHLAALSADTLIACLRYRPIEACPTFARGRSVIDRRRRPRPAASLRRILSHSGNVRVSDQTAKSRPGRVIAIGTSVVRALEREGGPQKS
jgi:hypothetical protein